MRALVFHGPHRLSVEDRDAPALAGGEIRISVIATGICGSDLHGYTGETGRRSAGQIMGHEFVGRIAEVGAEVDARRYPIGAVATVNPVLSCGSCDVCLAPEPDVCPNRRVIGVDPAISASFAEQIVVPASNVVLFEASEHVLVGALVEPLAVGYRAARRGGVSDGTAVVVLGGGPIGQAAALGARRLGGKVVVTEISQSRRQRVEDLGFPVVDPATGDVDGALQRALGRRPDVVIDAVGISATLRDALTLSAPGATIVLVGMGAPDVSLPAFRVSTEERRIIGSFCYSTAEFTASATWAAAHAETLMPLIDAVVPLDAAPDAFAQLASGTGDVSKILVLSGAGVLV